VAHADKTARTAMWGSYLSEVEMATGRFPASHEFANAQSRAFSNLGQ